MVLSAQNDSSTRHNSTAPPRRALVIVGDRQGITAGSDKAAVCRTVEQFAGAAFVASYHASDAAVRYALAAGVNSLVAPSFNADLMVFGRGGTDPEGDLRAAKLANQRQAGLILDVLEFRLDQSAPAAGQAATGTGEHGKLVVTRDLGRGAREILIVSFPVVLVMAEAAAPARYISRYRQMSAAPTYPLELPPDPPNTRWSPLRPRTAVKDLHQKTTGSATNRMFDAFGLTEVTNNGAKSDSLIAADPETCATHLLRFLAHHGLMDTHGDINGNAPLAAVKSTTTAPTPTDQAPVAPGNTDPTGLPSSLRRGPRPVDGDPRGRQRRPRAYGSSLPRPANMTQSGNIKCRPRPIGTEIPSDHRGPFPVAPSSDLQ